MAIDTHTMVAQPLFTESVTPYEVKTRLEALYNNRPHSLARSTVYAEEKPVLERVKEIEAALDAELGPCIYSEVGIGPLGDVDEGNFLYQSKGGHYTYLALANRGQNWINTYRPTNTEAIASLQRIIALMPRPVIKLTEKKQVEMAFWLHGAMGPTHINRAIAINPYSRVTSNYAAHVSDALKWTMDYTPGDSGKMFLWHGHPGTGKTHAIRALCWEWRKWARCHYITDPEAFFNSPNYMFQVMSNNEGGRVQFVNDDDEEKEREEGSKWNLIILEDCGELIKEDAKDRTGQGLSRLLNMVDGLLGQGMRILVLLTTNEEVQELHPAVMRAGRCAQELKFAPLAAAEANIWLKAHEIDREVTADTVIADLFAIKQATAPQRKARSKRALGFK